MPGHDIIVVGASAGGVEALMKLVGQLPEGLPASIFIVLHIPAQGPSFLPDILNRAGSLLAEHPEDGEAIQHGHIYVASPNQHLLIERGRIHLLRGPKENRHRPAIDPLFRSAAYVYGSRVVGVVLTGALDDGTAGLLAIKQRGGVVVVQDPHDALYPGMPQSALANVQVDYCLPLSAIGTQLVGLVKQQAKEEGDYPMPEDMAREMKYIEMADGDTLDSNQRIGAPSPYSCPDCGGVLWELRDGELLRFRCRVGHAFSIESVLAAQTEQLEAALWAALKTLEESASLSRVMARRASHRGQDLLAKSFEEQSHAAEQRAHVLRQVLKKEEPNGASDADMSSSDLVG